MNIKHINIVGVIHAKAGVEAARKARSRIDIAEFRADILSGKVSISSLKQLGIPLLWTVRSAAEGGAGKQSNRQRAALFEAGLAVASLLDIELASVQALSRTIEQAKAARCKVVLSFHDFQGTPSAAALKSIVRRGRDAGADIVKIATQVDSIPALVRLLSIFETGKKTPLAVMGMGKFGKVSRLLCAQAGSVLNYGWLHRPLVPGQWAAPELADQFRDLGLRQ